MLTRPFLRIIFLGGVNLLIGNTKIVCQDNFPITDIKIAHQKIKSLNKYASFKFVVTDKRPEIESCILKSDSIITSTCDISKGQVSILASFKTTGEHYFGFGEQYSHLDFKNTKPYIFTEEQGIGRGDKPVSKFTKTFGVCGDEVKNSSMYLLNPSAEDNIHHSDVSANYVEGSSFGGKIGMTKRADYYEEECGR